MRILFLCVANSTRSQMAEGIARVAFGNLTEVFSAGSHPTMVNSIAIDVMHEIGIDISHHQSKSIESINLASIDIIVTLCKEEICPVILGNQQNYHWPLTDPVNSSLSPEEQRRNFRKVRDELMESIRDLKKSLGF